MLETPILWLVPDLAASRKTIWIQDFSTRHRLGVARETPPSWFSKRLIEITETEDDSLVLALKGRWFSGWEVLDAENNHVGAIEGRAAITIKDALQHKVATWQESAGAFSAGDGSELSFLERSSVGTKLIFASAVERQPFTKMLLLAAALAPLLG